MSPLASSPGLRLWMGSFRAPVWALYHQGRLPAPRGRLGKKPPSTTALSRCAQLLYPTLGTPLLAALPCAYKTLSEGSRVIILFLPLSSAAPGPPREDARRASGPKTALQTSFPGGGARRAQCAYGAAWRAARRSLAQKALRVKDRRGVRMIADLHDHTVTNGQDTRAPPHRCLTDW